MTSPFTSSDGPSSGRPDYGLGFGPANRRLLHEQRRTARRELRESVRAHGDGPVFGGGPGPFGRGFGPGGRGFGPGSPGFGFGPGPRGGRRRGGHPGRGRRGDVRAAILKLLAERPMHGYEMIQEIAERSNELWRPSPGSVYPTLQLLEDEGLIAAAETAGSKKLFEVTEDGRAAADNIETAPWTEITEGADPGQVNLRAAVDQLFGAVAQSAHAATPAQQQRVVDIVNNARREIYQILGESD